MDGDHVTHDLALGDGILFNVNAPPLQLFVHNGAIPKLHKASQTQKFYRISTRPNALVIEIL